MCFYPTELDSDGHAVVLTADRDIPVQKLCMRQSRKTCISPFRKDFTYSFNNATPEVELIARKFYEHSKLEVHRGYHSVAPGSPALAVWRSVIAGRVSVRLYDGVIPKGAKYMFNSGENEYVSSSLRIDREAKVSVVTKIKQFFRELISL